MSAIYDRVQRRRARVEKASGSSSGGGAADYALWLQTNANPPSAKNVTDDYVATPRRVYANGVIGRVHTIDLIGIPRDMFIPPMMPQDERAKDGRGYTRCYKTPPAVRTPDGTPIWSPHAKYLVLPPLVDGATMRSRVLADIDLDDARMALGVETSGASLADLDSDKAKRHAADTPNPAVANIEFETDEERKRALDAEVADFSKVLAEHRARRRE